MVISNLFKRPVSRRSAVAGCVRAMLLAFAAMVALTWIGIAATPAAAQDRDPALGEFYETLDPHGEWIEHPRYGQTWVPYAGEDRGWRPYSRGQWAFTDEHGWYWESEEEFGWVVYHYGRWTLDQRHGWMWVPGTEWGPAWVAWREGEEAIGWAPLPPEADFDASVDGVYTFDTLDQPRYAPMWMFVAPAMLALPAVYRHFYPPNRSTYFFGRSRFATHYSLRDRQVFNRGIDRRVVERHSNRQVPVLRVRPMNSPQGLGAGRGSAERGAVSIYRPQIASPGPSRDGRGWPQGGRQPGDFGSRNPSPFGGGGGPGSGPGVNTQPPSGRGQAGFPPGGGYERDNRRDGRDTPPDLNRGARSSERTPMPNSGPFNPTQPNPGPQRFEPPRVPQQPPQAMPSARQPFPDQQNRGNGWPQGQGGFGGSRSGPPAVAQPPPPPQPPRPQVQAQPPQVQQQAQPQPKPQQPHVRPNIPQPPPEGGALNRPNR